MNIIELLKEQHRQVRGLFERIAIEDRKQRRSLVGELSTALLRHMEIEEKVVYPAAQKAFHGDEEQEERILVSFEEHAAAKHGLAELNGTPPGDKRFFARVRVLQEMIDHHVDEEESEVFPEMRAKLGEEQLMKLGDVVERRLSALETEAEPKRARRGAAARATKRRGAGARVRAGARQGRSRATKAPARSQARASGNNGNGSQGRPRRGESTSRS
jgi:hemerythrin superfamily protein